MSEAAPTPPPAVPAGDRALVLVLLGTDHHAFPRLVDWADGWGAVRPSVRVMVQHGRSRGPGRIEGRSLLPHAELQTLLRAATVVVSHGGPATITESRHAGKMPVVVPRDPARDEHVDSHQQLFSRRMAREGKVLLREEVEGLDTYVDDLLQHPDRCAADASQDLQRAAATARRVRGVLDEVVAGGRPGG